MAVAALGLSHIWTILTDLCRIQKLTMNTDSSPFQSSPLDSTTSPRLFWQNRNASKLAENNLYSGRSGSPSPTKRSSIERLEKASRVKNSTMFAREQKQEYDPTRVPTFERPLAKAQGNAFGGAGHSGFRSHGRSESQTTLPLSSPTKSISSPNGNQNRPPTPSKDQPSPTKSSLSLSRFKNSYDSQNDDVFTDLSMDDTITTTDGRFLNRHPKSVTFDAAPPQVNEYEMATPDISSIGTNSREGSFESEEDEDLYGPYPNHEGDLQDDSFDATLEDTDKTPVVGPDDWRRDLDSRFDSSPMPDGDSGLPALSRPQHGRTNSSTSSGEHRPLPPLPGMSSGRSDSASSPGVPAAAERMLSSPRNLPSPPPASVTKSEMHNIGNASMSLEERLKLMMLSDEASPQSGEKKAAKTFAEQQRERRMRRAGARDRIVSATPEREQPEPKVNGKAVEVEEADEADDTLGEISGLDMDYQLPSISRQSILRRVNGNQTLDRQSDYNFASSPAPDSSPERSVPYDPDVPIASIEDSVLDGYSELNEDSVIRHEIDDDEADGDEKGDVYDLYERSEDDGADSDKDHGSDDSGSIYSDDLSRPQSSHVEEDATTTPRASSPVQEDEVTNFSATLPQVNGSARTSDFTRSFQSYMLPKPKDPVSITHTEGRKEDRGHDEAGRPQTPLQPVSKPEYDGSGWGEPEEDEEEEEPGTPESVIHHPISDGESDYEDEEPIESPTVPERVATIKASSSKLKTRPSATPSDIEAMREARRQVSREVAPIVPPIPERHRSRMSRDLETEKLDSSTGSDFLERHPSFKHKSLTLDLDLGLSLDHDFDRVIEAQKVRFQDLTLNVDFTTASANPTGQASSANQAVNDSNPTTNNASSLAASNTNVTTRKQRGYLMRQNTKLVTASDKDNEDLRTGTRSAGNSPVKQHRPQSWTVEPWNGKQKRSIRKRHGPGLGGPVPPLPGQESNAAAMNTVQEEDAPDLGTDDCGERGRLFVKVMGVKDLDLPLPRSKLCSI